MDFSQHNRIHFSEKLKNETFDLLVIGGGITGCGIALDAALRGMKVALIEKHDFGWGTSSRSTKLIHGGLRYLKQLELKLVHDVGRERAVVYHNAMHVVIPEKMLLPIVHNGSLGKQTSSFGLWIYDMLAGVKNSERRKMLSKHETQMAEPLLDEKKLLGGGLYYEYRTDDARLVIELAKTAFRHGATLLNYCELKSFNKNEQGKIESVVATDHISKSSFEIKAKYIVNACGPWVDLLRKEDESLKGKRLQLTKGVHIVFPFEKLPLQQAAYFDVADGRMIFAIPRNGITYVGTTDTVYNQDIDKPIATKSDVAYLLKAINEMFPTIKLTQADVVSSWAGLRPLIYEDGKSASELSRKDEIIISNSGLISIAGGKLTGYRLMAKKIVDLVAKNIGKVEGRTFGNCSTKRQCLTGGNFSTPEEAARYLSELQNEANEVGFNKDEVETLFHKYGSESKQILLKAKFYFEGKTATAPMLLAELDYCIQNENIFTAADFFIRRTGSIFFNRVQTHFELEPISQKLTNEWNLNEAELQSMLNEIESEYAQAVSFN
ncbi:MAG TPA: glycerol-3-phosphate dehydrogenase/oxidase [Chitinophagales bacterium]|nr:glycerol-3-phosphate dehydrogenase/oxidase [Chitinophagales bacterium]